MKCKVMVSSMTSSGEYIKAGSVQELDKKEEQKLFDLGNVREYDKKLDGEAPLDDTKALKAKIAELQGQLNNSGDTEALKTKVTELNEANTVLEGEKTELTAKVAELTEGGDKALLEENKTLQEKVEKLDGFVKEAIQLKKFEKPVGYEG